MHVSLLGTRAPSLRQQSDRGGSLGRSVLGRTFHGDTRNLYLPRHDSGWKVSKQKEQKRDCSWPEPGWPARAGFRCDDCRTVHGDTRAQTSSVSPRSADPQASLIGAPSHHPLAEPVLDPCHTARPGGVPPPPSVPVTHRDASRQTSPLSPSMTSGQWVLLVTSNLPEQTHH